MILYMKKILIFLDEVRSAIREGTYRQNMKTYFLPRIAKLTVGILTLFSKLPGISGLLKFQPGKFGFFVRDTYFLTHNAGLMSCCSLALSDITAAGQGVKNIRSNFGMSLYKKLLLRNNWKSYFQTPIQTDLSQLASAERGSYPNDIHDWWGKDYAVIPFKDVLGAVGLYFRLSPKVVKLSDVFVEKYGINLEETIGVHYRGTDKQTEIETPSLTEFISQTRHFMQEMANPKILLLTDEPAVANGFEAAFPNAVITINELATPGGSLGAHTRDSKEPEVQGQIFLAILSLVSKCKKVVTHTGNGALWEVLFRESTEGLKQIRTQER
jgi:hypothetical protein